VYKVAFYGLQRSLREPFRNIVPQQGTPDRAAVETL
jgi:hypothetical protein